LQSLAGYLTDLFLWGTPPFILIDPIHEKADDQQNDLANREKRAK
tara:strand:- start:664 stop:798 length:135 start_codon:yes stop_codon:yes gene_type:complete